VQSLCRLTQVRVHVRARVYLSLSLPPSIPSCALSLARSRMLSLAPFLYNNLTLSLSLPPLSLPLHLNPPPILPLSPFLSLARFICILICILSI